jgi:hypothetical protein
MTIYKYMDLKELINQIKELPSDRFEMKLREIFRTQNKYFNLDENNKKIVFDLIKKYRANIVRNVYPSDYTIQKEMYNLYQNRLKLNLTEEDLEDIKEILNDLKK